MSARKAFARSGYDGAGVREIAEGAGVTAMLVNRYFGSKEGLFAEALAATMATPIILAPENLGLANPAAAFAKALVSITEKDATPLDGFLILLRSASSERAAEIGREQIEKRHQKVMASLVKGEAALPRAAIALSLIAGFQVMRQMVGLTALTDASDDELVRILEPLFEQLLNA
ncbi:TetR/AcrR family transcriptional regulator [Granulicella sibirica]|uniref:Transcriptional regulator, TetR family n=1 Tax=Granulicella sibirica TaxID=2479048 RepID=A0A4Q0T4N5_9BACT|nr:TetR/AcrR family transcriptional regulator [Granulicella sibirica]RXH57912.1 Transcriptional regulator, TetR family [Granulicella sibirica]